MKNLSFILIALGLVAVTLYISYFLPPKTSSSNVSTQNLKIIQYPLNGKTLSLYVADTPAKWEKGLMYFRKLEGVDGMIFIFSDKQIRTFWNKNTFMDLDMYWMNDSTVIGNDFLPSVEKQGGIVTVTSPRPANKVIEVAAR